MQRANRRQALKRHHCDTCTGAIEKAEPYLEHVISPNHDGLGNPKWWRMRECEDCARRAGRTLMLDHGVIQMTVS